MGYESSCFNHARYDAFGNLAAEYGPTAPTPCVTSNTCYVTVDHLGSTRMLTDASGTPQARYDYLPFGSEILAGTDGRTTAMGYQSTPDQTNPKFTGQQRDPETSGPGYSLDWFNARYLSGAQGRFQSVDPANAGANSADPQTWNGYAYVGNNPLSYTDPSGMVEAAGGGGGDGFGAVAGLIVQGLEVFGSWISSEFSGGSKPTPAPIPFTGPTWSVTGW
ncbi:MAG: RHS repeat-associated core domain-containing protein, partial [Terracidiphilus sp.]